MKKNNKWLISLFTIFVFLCASCNNFLSRETQKEVEKTAAQTKTGRLSFNVNGASSRSVFPDTSIQNFTNFVLTGSVEGNNNTQNLGSWSNVQDLLNASIEIAIGTWNLTLSAKRDTVDFAATAQVTIEEGQNATASFKLSAVQTSTGIANITLRFPENSGICTARWIFYDDGAYDTFWYNNGNEIEGLCYIDGRNNESDISCEQTITDSSFSLKAALPAGRYRFRCVLGTEITGVGNYYDFIVIQPGFESALDYTIDYFEFTGITDAVSTEQGMQLTLMIPKGVQNLEIMRIKDYAGLMQAQEEYHNNPDPNVEPPDTLSATTIITKKLDAKTTSQTTLQLVDSYGYEAGDELTYAVYFDMDSFSSVIKTFTASHDGIPVPEFTSYPEFAIESNDQGITSKIKISNDPVLDWKGHELSSGYKLYLSNDSMMGIFFPEVVVDSTTKEYVIEDGSLNPGQTSFVSYRLGLDSNGLSYSFSLNTKNLSGAQLPPVLQGPSPAQATDEGIHILLNGTYEHWSYLSILRATSPEGEWVVIKDKIDCDYGEFHINYTDKYDLVAGTTYYYKVVNDRGQSFGGEYFSATATVTKGPYASITTQPVLAVSNDAVASFTPGALQFAEPDEVGSVTFAYEYIQQDNSNIELTIKYTKYTGNDNYSFEGNYTGGLWAKFYANDQSLDLYNYYVNGNKFSFSKAYILINDKYYNTLKQFDFTPAQGSCPSEIQIPNKKIGLTATPTSDGIVLSITNISEGVNYLEIKSSDDINNLQYNCNRKYSYSNGEGFAGSLNHTDKYVDGNKEYYYLVTDGSYRSDIISVTSTGGSGELWVSSYPAGELGLNENGEKMISFTQAGQLTVQDLPENTSWYLDFEYRSNSGNGKADYTMGLHYSSSLSNCSIILYGQPGLYEPSSVSLGVYFPDYSYWVKKNVSTFAPMPQQITID